MRGHARVVALGGSLGAGSLLFLYAACVAPSGKLGLCAVAGLFPLAAGMACAPGVGIACWAAVGLLGLVLLPDKGIALLFCLFLGLYPLGKARLERLPGGASWICKLGWFNLIFLFFLLVLQNTLFTGLTGLLSRRAVLLLLGNAVFLAYDLGLSGLSASLLRRLGPWLKGQGRQ